MAKLRDNDISGATRSKVKEDLIDLIIAQILQNYPKDPGSEGYPIFNPYSYKKVIDETTGQVTTDLSAGSNMVIYQEDYQDFESDFNDYLEDIADCYCDGGVDNHICDGSGSNVESDYFSVSAEDAIWTIEDDDGDTDQDFRIVWNLGAYNGCSPSDLHITEFVFVYLSQLVGFDLSTIEIDPSKAAQVLDTTIFELLPKETTRQEKINKFFKDFENLIGDIPLFDFDIDGDGVSDTWSQNVYTNQDNYSNENDVSVEFNKKDDGNITRLNRHADDENQNQTLEWMRNRINDHLTDIDKKIDPIIVDERPDYENQSDGYLKIRNLNQSIIIRSQEGEDVGLIGPDKTNPIWKKDGFTITMWVKFLDKKQGGTLFNFGNPFRENNPYGFVLETFSLNKNGQIRLDPSSDSSIQDISTTWGEWIDCKTAWPATEEDDDGNPIPYSGHPYFCQTKSITPRNYFSPNHTFFKDSDWERFVRLVVREDPNPNVTNERGVLRDSHIGLSKGREGFVSLRRPTTEDPDFESCPEGDCYYKDGWGGTIPTAPLWALGNAYYEGYECPGYVNNKHCNFWPTKLLNYTRIPTNTNEWYFLVANYNPDINEVVLCPEGIPQDDNCDCNPLNEPVAVEVEDDSQEIPDEWEPVPGGNQCGPNGVTSLKFFSDYWRWHVGYFDENGQLASELEAESNDDLTANTSIIGKYTHNSGYGAKCKVEVISKSDFIRASGYKSEKS